MYVAASVYGDPLRFRRAASQALGTGVPYLNSSRGSVPCFCKIVCNGLNSTVSSHMTSPTAYDSGFLCVTMLVWKVALTGVCCLVYWSGEI